MNKSKTQIFRDKIEQLQEQAKKHAKKQKEINNKKKMLLFAHQAKIGQKLEEAYGDTISDAILDKLILFIKASPTENN